MRAIPRTLGVVLPSVHRSAILRRLGQMRFAAAVAQAIEDDRAARKRARFLSMTNREPEAAGESILAPVADEVPGERYVAGNIDSVLAADRASHSPRGEADFDALFSQ